MASNQRSDRRWMVLFLVAAMLLWASRWHLSRQTAGLKPVADRTQMADLTLPELGGGEWKLADHRGQVVLINFWATWCGPCREELPDLLQVARESSPKGLAVVGISMDSGQDVQARVQRFVTGYRVAYPVAFPNASLKMESGEMALPTTILLDREGRTAKTYVGEVERAVLAKDIAALLAES